jgi:hypothetical protein
MGDLPYPSQRSGIDLSKNRAVLLDQWKRSVRQAPLTKQTATGRLADAAGKQGGAE